MINWMKGLFNKHKNNVVLDKIRSPIDRVYCKNITNDLGGKRKYSIYGIISKDNKIYAIVHWQGWEDAGWKLIPIDELEPFRTPDLSKVEFYYTYPNDIHKWYHKLPATECIIKEYYMNKDILCAVIEFMDGNQLCTSTEYLLDVKDPQFYGD